jgi:hypothetical protein
MWERLSRWSSFSPQRTRAFGAECRRSWRSSPATVRSPLGVRIHCSWGVLLCRVVAQNQVIVRRLDGLPAVVKLLGDEFADTRMHAAESLNGLASNGTPCISRTVVSHNSVNSTKPKGNPRHWRCQGFAAHAERREGVPSACSHGPSSSVVQRVLYVSLRLSCIPVS